MVKYYDEIPDFLATWIGKQKMFWVATAPLTGEGLVSLSPKGGEGSFRIMNPKRVWYEDLTGSGIETVSHVRENGRITILFNAFEGPARISRLYGKGTVYEFGSPEYEALLPPEKRHVGSRAIIMIDVFKASTSCGYSVPFYTYKGPRERLLACHLQQEAVDIEAELNMDPESTPPLPKKGLKRYWFDTNQKGQDGLPGLLSGYESTTRFHPSDIVIERGRVVRPSTTKFVPEVDVKLVVAFLTGVMVSASYVKLISRSS